MPPLFRLPRLNGPNPEDEQQLAVTPGFNPQAGQTLPLKRPSTYEGSLALSLGGEPAPPKVPPMSQPKGPEGAAMPGRSLPSGVAGPQSPAAEMAEAKEAYNAGYKKPEGFGARLRNFAGGLGRGAIEGIRTGQGIIPGAISQGALAAADPRGERELQFNQRIAPKIAERQGVEAADLNYKRQNAAYDQSQSDAALGRRKVETDIAGEEARTRATIAGIPDPEQMRQKSEAEIELKKAQAEAARRGRPVLQDVVGSDGQIHKMQFNPDGSQTDLGVSGAQAQMKSRETIAASAESGRNTRFSQGEAGKDKRKLMGPGAGLKPVTDKDIDEAMKDKANAGLNRAQVVNIFTKNKYNTAGLKKK